MKTNPKSGTTLVEILVVMGILSFLSAVLFRVYTNFQGSFQKDVTNRLVLQINSQRAADKLFLEIKKGTDIVRPLLAETTPFLVYKDIRKRTGFLYLDRDKENSSLFKKDLYKLVSYVCDYSGSYKPENERIIVNSVQSLWFTAITPSSVQIDMTLANDRQSFEFLTHLGFLNAGDIE